MLTHRLEFVPERDAEIFAAIPSATAVFLLRGNDPQAEPYVTKSANLRRRLIRLLGSPEERTKRLNLRDRIRWIEYSLAGSHFESGFLLYKVLRATFPNTYSKRLRLRLAPMIKLHMENEFPRASITTRLGRLNGPALYYGPFPSRTAAEKFANDSLDFFKMRRCVENLHPDPKFPGCIYSEMKMCLAPCFKGCTDEEYRNEVARVQAYLDSRGDSLVREISMLRDEASNHLDFENAAATHARLEKLSPLLGQLPEIVHRLDRLAAVMLQPSSIPESTITPAVCKTALELMEHLAILKRWYYRSHRIGEILFADEKGRLPMRRIVRGISRVYRGERPETDLAATVITPPNLL